MIYKNVISDLNKLINEKDNISKVKDFYDLIIVLNCKLNNSCNTHVSYHLDVKWALEDENRGLINVWIHSPGAEHIFYMVFQLDIFNKFSVSKIFNALTIGRSIDPEKIRTLLDDD